MNTLTNDGIFITKNHKSNYFRYEDIDENLKEQIRRQKYGIRQRIREQERKDDEEYKLTHKHGYCPKCGGLISLNGTCTVCGD